MSSHEVSLGYKDVKDPSVYVKMKVKGSENTFFQGTVFDNLDFLTNQIMLPLGGLLITVFAGWVMCRNSTADELGGAGASYKAWRLAARFVAPVGIFFVLFFAIKNVVT